MSPTEDPSQKRRCDQDDGRVDESQERGTDPPPSRNGSPSIVDVARWGEALNSVTECPFNKEQVAAVLSHYL